MSPTARSLANLADLGGLVHNLTVTDPMIPNLVADSVDSGFKVFPFARPAIVSAAA
jgi:hypothetical protein